MAPKSWCSSRRAPAHAGGVGTPASRSPRPLPMCLSRPPSQGETLVDDLVPASPIVETWRLLPGAVARLGERFFAAVTTRRVLGAAPRPPPPRRPGRGGGTPARTGPRGAGPPPPRAGPPRAG